MIGSDAGAERLGTGRIAGGLFLDHPFDHGPGKGDAAGLHRLQIAGRQQVQVIAIHRVGGNPLQRPQRRAGRVAQMRRRVRQVQQVADSGRGGAGDVDQQAVAQGDNGWALHLGPPAAAQPQAFGGVDRDHSGLLSGG